VALLDVNIWLAALWGDHIHHDRASVWFAAHDGDLVMCRVTQTGVLRLLSNPKIMGPDVLTRAQAWAIFDRLRTDDRVRWASEPPHLEHVWRVISAREDNSHRLWTDDYLAAFAQAADLTLVTLDRGFKRRYPSVTVETLV
jgi:toxin-antitoxin system PIN domain toxin